MATYQEQLAEINAAITAVVTRGQRYKIGDRELWRPDLEWLHAERKRLEPLAAAERRGGPRVRRVVPL
jgi:hypothetical protein